MIENSVDEMSLRKGFFRLTLVFSILIGTIAPFCHEWIFKFGDKGVTLVLPNDWNNKSLQEKLNCIDDSQVINPFSWVFLSKLEKLNVRRQIRERIASDVNIANKPKQTEEWITIPKKKGQDLNFRPDQPSPQKLYFYPEVGWRELSLLAFVGFASPWLIYLFIRWVVVGFIVGGFKEKTNP